MSRARARPSLNAHPGLRGGGKGRPRPCGSTDTGQRPRARHRAGPTEHAQRSPSPPGAHSSRARGWRPTINKHGERERETCLCRRCVRWGGGEAKGGAYCWKEGSRGGPSAKVTSQQKPKAKEGASWRVTWDTALRAEGRHAGSREAGAGLAHAWCDDGGAGRPPAGRSGVRRGGGVSPAPQRPGWSRHHGPVTCAVTQGLTLSRTLNLAECSALDILKPLTVSVEGVPHLILQWAP